MTTYVCGTLKERIFCGEIESRNVSTLIYYLLRANTALFPFPPLFLPLFLLLATPLSLLFLFPLFSLLFFLSLLLGGLLL